MRKPAFCICENKDADQLRGDCEADQRLCFRYIDTTIPLLSKSEISSFEPSSVACVGPGRKPHRFSHNEAQMLFLYIRNFKAIAILYSYTCWFVSENKKIGYSFISQSKQIFHNKHNLNF